MGKPPELWSPEEAEAAKQAFLERRPTVTAEQALELWQYWRWSHPDELLFDDPEDSLALVVHARAHGATVPGAEDDGVVGQLQRTHGKLLAPLVPGGPAWGPRAALSPVVRAALDAPVMEAWVYSDGRDPDLILIVGKGVPEIRRRVLPDALITSLRVRCVADDFVNDGVIRIEMPGPHPAALPVPPLPLLGQYVGVLPPTAARAARSAMADLIGRLRQLENETGLIRVLEAHRSAHDDLFSSITTMAEAAQDGPVLCTPDAAGQGPGAIAVVPYRQVPSDAGGVLQLELSTDLLRSRAYDELERLHQRATIDRIMSDISLRREYYQKEAKNFRDLAEEYLSADEEERGLLFGDTVRVTLEWDAALGLPRRLTRPEEIRAETYYTEVVPGLEQTYRDWQARMEAMATGIAEATRRGDAPLPRLLASRFFDAALRDGEGHDDPDVQAAFEAWREDVQPMIVLEWRRILRRLDLAERDVFTRQTFFHTWRTVSSLIVAPFAVLDRSRTAVLMDPERRVMVVRDPVHRAVLAGRDEDAEALWGQLDAMIQARPPSAGRESQRATGPEFVAALLDALRRSPCEILRRILEELSDPSRQAPASELTDLEGRLVAGLAATRFRRQMEAAVVALQTSAYQSARKLLDELPEAGPWMARAWLLRAVVECFAAELDDPQTARALRDPDVGTPGEIRRAVQAARVIDPDFTRRWLEGLLEDKVGRSIGRLLGGIEKADMQHSIEERAALMSRSAVEIARVAHDLEAAATRLSSLVEPADAVLGKLGRPLEDVFLAELAGGMRETAWDILTFLRGRR